MAGPDMPMYGLVSEANDGGRNTAQQQHSGIKVQHHDSPYAAK